MNRFTHLKRRAALIIKRDGYSSVTKTGINFVRSPVIIAIVLGIAFNLSGLNRQIEHNTLVKAIYSTMQFVASMIVPLILIVVGYGLELRQVKIKVAMGVVLVRFVLLVPLAIMVNFWIIRGILHLDKLYEAALFIFLILPPPFIIPLFIKKENLTEQQTINGILMIHAVFSLIAFTLYYAYYSMPG